MKRWAPSISSQKAFTIVELLIVIVIIGILAAIIIVGYGAVQNNAQDTAFKAELTKLGDQIKLVALDNSEIPSGGSGNGMTGDSTILPGVVLSPNKDMYDTTTPNFYYCAGMIDGSKEFALIAKSKRGAIFYYKSNTTVTQLPDSTAMSQSVLCGATGFTVPYTQSYGYYPLDQYRWFAWANGSAPTITNIAANPKGIGVASGWFAPIVPNVTETTGISWNGETGWHRFVWNGTGPTTVRLELNLSDLTNGTTYTSSMLVGNSGGTPVTWTMDLSDESVTAFSLEAGEMKRVYLSASRSVYDSTYKFVDFNLTVSNAQGLLVRDALVTKGTEQYLYRDGSSIGWTWNGTANASTSKGPGELSQ